jgi:hypothetical protein
MDEDALQRLADDEEIMDAVELMKVWGVTPVIFDKLVERLT